MAKKKSPRRKGNYKANLIVLLIPVVCGLAVFIYLITGEYQQQVSQAGVNRLETAGWNIAQHQFKAATPEISRNYAYYKVKERQDITELASRFSVPADKLAAINPGIIVAGTTVKVTPLESALTPLENTNGLLPQTRVTLENDVVRIKQDFKNPKVTATFPELAAFLAQYGAIEKTGEKSYRLMKSLSIEDNIRIDMSGPIVETVELNSPAGKSVCLCIENSELLIKGVQITSYDPAVMGPDINQADERSFIRALKSARMDIIDSDISYLGNAINISNSEIQREGGTYGVSWRIPANKLGSDIVTGWVENTQFHHNHFGSYTFGASGMVWAGNRFYENEVYGLDPHDDSNNALIENNIFESNGKHGFILSKRCNYNIIRKNLSFGNKYHGFMLHQDSSYNMFENNIAYNNIDNFVIFASDNNVIKGNSSFNPRSSHIRINGGSNNTFITDNIFGGGGRGVYVYDNSKNIYTAGNTFRSTKEIVMTDNATNVYFGENIIDRLAYRLGESDRIIFGPNSVRRVKLVLPIGVYELKALSPKIITESDEEF